MTRRLGFPLRTWYDVCESPYLTYLAISSLSSITNPFSRHQFFLSPVIFLPGYLPTALDHETCFTKHQNQNETANSRTKSIVSLTSFHPSHQLLSIAANIAITFTAPVRWLTFKTSRQSAVQRSRPWKVLTPHMQKSMHQICLKRCIKIPNKPWFMTMSRRTKRSPPLSPLPSPHQSGDWHSKHQDSLWYRGRDHERF